jgi:glutaredoxin-like protein NrdH
VSEVQVYCKPDCVQCEYTKKKLDEYHIPHTDLDVVQHPIFAEQLQEQGVFQLPYVVAGAQSWTGFQYDKLRGLNPADYT